MSGSADAHPGSHLNHVLLKAEDEAKSLKDDFVSVEHLLLGLLEEGGVAGRQLGRRAEPRPSARRSTRGPR